MTMSFEPLEYFALTNLHCRNPIAFFSRVVPVVPAELNSTLTSPSGVAGCVRTPAPDMPYLDNLHYTKRIVAEPGTGLNRFNQTLPIY